VWDASKQHEEGMGRNEARSPGDELHDTFHSLEDAQQTRL